MILLLWQITGLRLPMRFLIKREGSEDTHSTAVVVVLSCSLLGVLLKQMNLCFFLFFFFSNFYGHSDAICLGKYRQASIFVALLQHLLMENKGNVRVFKADIFPPISSSLHSF